MGKLVMPRKLIEFMLLATRRKPDRPQDLENSRSKKTMLTTRRENTVDQRFSEDLL
jgi:hypothetical protein